MTISAADAEHDYNSFADDVMGEEKVLEDEDDDEDFYSKRGPKFKGGESEEKEKSTPYMFFDFRRGFPSWPKNVEVIDPKKADVLLEKATKSAEKKAAKTKKEEDNELSKDDKTGTSWNDKFEEADEDEPIVAPSEDDISFEVLRDGSTALVIKPGHRLRLKLDELNEGGDDERETREKAAAKAAAKKKSYSSEGNDAFSWGAMMGPQYNPWDFNTNKSKWTKNYINEYTITMDIKLLEEAPRDGISLFQTALIHAKDDKKLGKTTLTRSDGECIINQMGGVGIFGTFGDTAKAKVKKSEWKRVVIAVKCAESKKTKGEYRTWVGTEAGVILKEEAFEANDRFSIDPSNLFLFSSAQSSMMPGRIAVRTIRVTKKFSSDHDVKNDRALGKLVSKFDEDRKLEVSEQRRGLSLAPLFPKPRPMWAAPTFVAAFGDAFIENTSLEANAGLSWSYAVLNYAMQKVIDLPLIAGPGSGFDYDARVGLSDTLHVLRQSEVIFKHMMKMMKNPTESGLLSFLRKLKKVIAAVGVGESLLLPLLVEGRELMILLEKTTERAYKFVIVQTDPKGGMSFHAASPEIAMPEIRYRTCLVLNNVTKKNALDDVFWLAAFNMCVHKHSGDTHKFYDILIPFLTEKSLEASLVEAEEAFLYNPDRIGDFGLWRAPQRSNTAHVRCVFEVVYFMLRKRKLSELQANQVHLCLLIELVLMMQNDLNFMLPDDNGVRICALSLKELSRSAVKIVDQADAMGFSQLKNEHSSSDEQKSGDGIDVAMILNEVHSLVQSIDETLTLCKHDEFDLPPALDLSEPQTKDSNDLALTQFADALSWDVPLAEPDPGQAVNLRKYIPVDLLQIPKRAFTREQAVTAIRICDRMCTLVENQSHCIKNDKFIILSVIEHVFTQVVPLPKPRGINISDAELYRSSRSARRAESKKLEEENRVAEKKAKADEKAKLQSENSKGSKAKSKRSVNSGVNAEDNATSSKKKVTKYIGADEILPDFDEGKLLEKFITEQPCIWDQPISYELQVELLLTIQRLIEHFAAAAMSIQQSRPSDAVCIIVPGCMCAISDAVIRRIAEDEPSEVSSHLMGRTIGGKQLGHPGYGISVGSFATQSETIEIHSPELSIARTAVLDYFQSPSQRKLEKFFTWENDYDLKPTKELIKFIRMISRDTGLSVPRPYLMLLDGKPMCSSLMKNYPELRCYRDVAFWWKFFLNPDRKDLPNYVNPDAPNEIPRWDRMSSQLTFDWDGSKNCFTVQSFGRVLRCRPDPNQIDPLTGKKVPADQLPLHRFPSTATPSFYVVAPAIKTEDDVIYRPNLPNFEDKYGQVLNQRDSELLISYLTVPYMRIPLILTFFASDDRIHKLRSVHLRQIFDSVMFEPSKYLKMEMSNVEPMMVPTPYSDLLASPYGLLMNELCRSPDTVINSIIGLLRGGLACDTGSVIDEKATEFNASTTIILYICRLGSRVDNYLSFLIDWSTGKHDCIDWPLRETEISEETLLKLQNGRQELRDLLHGKYSVLFEEYLKLLDSETVKDAANESLIQRNSRLACDLHSHKMLIYRNYHEDDFESIVAKTVIGSFVYLTTRHTWNKSTKEGSTLQMPETQLYELLQIQRRRLVNWLSHQRQGITDEIMQTALQVSSSLTGSLKASTEFLDNQNRWSKITGERSVGRWAVGSTRTVAMANSDSNNSNSNLGELCSNSSSSDLNLLLPIPKLMKQSSFDAKVGEVADNGMLGVEIDVQMGQMTLRSKHLAALPSDIANHPDVLMIFGDATMQASLLEKAENRQRYRLVGLNHELEFWPTEHTICPSLGDQWEREYDPSELFDSEKWIASLFEPVRTNFFNGPNPPPMQFMMPEKAIPADAEVAIILGLHQSIGGPFKLIYLFRRLRCLHIYECVSQGREWWFSLHLTTDTRFCLREMSQNKEARREQFPDWWVRAGGSPYPMELSGSLYNDIDGISSNAKASVLIVRDPSHQSNLSGGKEISVPSRFLYGVLPDSLLENYNFWQDESICPMNTLPENLELASRGYKRLRGYSTNADSEFMMLVEFQFTGLWSNMNNSSSEKINDPFLIQCTMLPGRTVSVTRRPKHLVEDDFRRRQRIASHLEALRLLVPPKPKKREIFELDASAGDLVFKVDALVECDYEGKGEFWPCVVRRLNDNGTYDLEYINDFKWVGVQRGVEPENVQKRGECERQKNGEGLWHWDGMTESEEDDWCDDSDNEKRGSSNEDNVSKNRLNYFQFDQLHLLLEAANGNEEDLMEALDRLGRVPGVNPFTDVKKLAASVAEIVLKLMIISDEPQKRIDAEDMTLLNLLYAPRRSRLFSLMKVLSRIENLGHICAWTKTSNLKNPNAGMMEGVRYGCPIIDLVEMPRLKLSFTARSDHTGLLRLYSVDHVDLYITNDNNSMTAKMIAGIPHSLLLSNVRGEMQVLVPVIPSIHRPHIATEPFSTFIVLDRKGVGMLAERFFLYPVHVSLSFLLTKGLNSAVYLMLLRFLHRDYNDVFRLADSIATDTTLNQEGLKIFQAFAMTNDDSHPDAHACRLKISLVTIDSGTPSSWDLTKECAKHIVKADSISASCRISPTEELQLLESDYVVTNHLSPKYVPSKHDEYFISLCYNRLHLLRAQVNRDSLTTQKNEPISALCQIPPRPTLSNWSYYQDNTVFGENYSEMTEIIFEKDGLHPWIEEMKGCDELDAPPGGWLVVACFHTLWSTGCIKIMPTVTELVPMFQDSTTFLSVRADCQGMMKMSKSLKIKCFPTFLVLRGGTEISRIEGEDHAIEKLIRCLSKSLLENMSENGNQLDKIAHSKRVYRQKLEKALTTGAELPEEENDERGQIDWTWDPEQCGSSMQIQKDGTLAALIDDEFQKESAIWQHSYNRREWVALPVKTNAVLEAMYQTGDLYRRGYFEDEEFTISLEDIQISSYEITGFGGYHNQTGNNCSFKRWGERFSAPGEEDFLSDAQKQRDKEDKEWKDRYQARIDLMKQQRIGKDIEIIRGSIGFLPNSGIHYWRLQWNHEPGRGGSCDSVGVCSDNCEAPAFGPGKAPLLGATDSSIGLHANGELYFNNKLIRIVKGKERETIDTKENCDESKGDTLATTTAYLFGKSSIIRLEFDTSLDGGTLRFTVDSEVLDVTIINVYQMLGGTEIFPCISMCPKNPVVVLPVIPVPAEISSPADNVEAESDPNENADSDELSEPKVVVDTPHQPEIIPEPSVTLLSHDEIIIPVSKKEDTLALASNESQITEIQGAKLESVPSGESKAAEEEKEVAVDNGSNNDSSPVDPPQQIETMIESIRWMYETEKGWLCYSTEVSNELERAHRDGKSEYSLAIGSSVHKCNLEKKKLFQDETDKEFRLRRHEISEGIAGKWEILTMNYEKPFGLTGPGLIKLLEKVWKGSESFSGQECGLGFLFLYSLLSGETKCRVISANEGFSSFPGYGKYSSWGKGATTGGSSNDSHRFAVLLTQLYADKQHKSLPASVVTVLCRNRQISLRMPKFKDTRKVSTTSYFQGWCDEVEPRSPTSELFSKIVPLMTMIKKKGGFHFPPLPPHPELPQPPSSTIISTSSSSHFEGKYEEWERPELSDYACESRSFSALDSEKIDGLLKLVGHKLGAGMLRPQPPLHIEDTSHFEKVVTENSGRIIIADFHATWCGPCKTLTPVFRRLSLMTPTALFLKIDVDICDDLAARFKIESMPTILFIKCEKSSDSVTVLGIIKGGGPEMLNQFSKLLSQFSSVSDLEALRKFHEGISDDGEANKEIIENLAIKSEDVDIFACQPLDPCSRFISKLTRTELGMQNVNGELNFDLTTHEAASTAPAKTVLNRFKIDVKAHADSANESAVVKIVNLSDADILSYFQGDPQAKIVLQGARAIVSDLTSQLYNLRDSDAEMVQNSIPLVEKVANFVALDNETSNVMRLSKIRFLLNRTAGLNATAWVEFLFGILISSQGEADLLRLNPYLSEESLESIKSLITIGMLRANRLGHINRCIGLVIGLENLLDKVLKVPLQDREVQGATLAPKLIQLAEELAKNLTMARHYMKDLPNGAFSFDPRYLVFEFVWNIQLRKKQVEIVNDFRINLNNGTSKVKQMIMGAGKTSVVAPLLALIVADGKSLVLSVVPKALVEMSRTRMRESFAAIMVKRIYTLDFDRSTTVKPSMRRSLENAAANRGVVVATPTTLKSVMLSYVEVLQHLKEAHTSGVKSKILEYSSQADELSKILTLFKNGIMLLDEVDLILHPLKSELNFPIGDKFDLDGSDEGERWGLPIHLLDAIFFTHTGRVTTFEQQGVAGDILRRLKDVIQIGISNRSLQRLPHVTLLNMEFYNSHIKPIIAEWAFLWLQKQHIHGVDRHEAVQYMLEGAAARGDSATKVSLIELELVKIRQLSGETLPGTPPTQGFLKTFTGSERANRLHKLQEKKEKNALNARSSQSLMSLYRSQIKYLQLANEMALVQKQLADEIYEIDEKIEDHSRTCDKRKVEVQRNIIELQKKITDLECPRDDSLDNSVVVWCSQAFGSNRCSSSDDTSSSAALVESSVPALCNILEDNGFIIRRCSETDEAISRARDLQEEGQLRCIILGGDEKSTGCTASCRITHEISAICLKCHKGWSHHNGHNCHLPGSPRGSFPAPGIKDDKPGSRIDALAIVTALTDKESTYARTSKSLPSDRALIYSAHTHMKENQRMKFWNLGTSVTDDPKGLISYVTSLMSWKTEEARMDEEEEFNNDDNGHDDSEVKFKLATLRAELEELENLKVSFADNDEIFRKSLQQQSAKKHELLNASVNNRIQELEIVQLNFKPIIDHVNDDDYLRVLNDDHLTRMSIGPHCGRDASLAIAWFETNVSTLIPSEVIVDDSLVKELLKNYQKISNELSFLRRMVLAAKVVAHVTSPHHKKLLNLCHNWLCTFLPHCLAKVNRVSFGLLSAEDCKAALEADPHVPRSRLKLGVPFVGKDVPSKSSEFAHPDVIIGLTILAYRYTGLRKDDFVDIVDSLTAQFSHEIGPARDRESSLRHEQWVFSAGGKIRGLEATRDGKLWVENLLGLDEPTTREVVQLKFLQKSNQEQMDRLYELIRYEPLVIHHYLQKSIFPIHMRSQRMKISASGQAVGGDMLFAKRVGFSGTPSDLLPQELGSCDYETGDDGMMLSTVLDPKVASHDMLQDNWTVEDLLDRIANADSPRINALIDTGALITGYSNEEVAKRLLDRGLMWCEGVVFLDDDDKQQVLVRATGRVVSADQCGVSLEKRFAFYDQIHTTGMDIKHVVNATAVITLGKDMVFRDYVQGAYRMRGIGAGQRIHLFIIPEVRELMARELRSRRLLNDGVMSQDEKVLLDVVAWLIVNSLRSEQIQWTMLCLQNIGNLYRKNAFRCLHKQWLHFVEGKKGDTKAITEAEVVEDDCEPNSGSNSTMGLSLQIPQSSYKNSSDSASPSSVVVIKSTEEEIDFFVSELDSFKSLQVFDEPIDFSLEASVPNPLPFEEKLRSMLDSNEEFLMKEQHDIGRKIMLEVGQFAMLESSASRLDSEQEREQEQEQEKEVEARRDQQIEVEKFVDREYSRQEEVQRPWAFHLLGNALPQRRYLESDGVTATASSDDHPFYPLCDFKLRHQEPLQFHDALLLSANYFNPDWTGLRRVKNVVMVLEYSPSTTPDFLRLKKEDEYRTILTISQEQALAKAHALLGFHAANAGFPGFLARQDLIHAIQAATDITPSDETVDSLIQTFSLNKSMVSLEEFKSLFTCGKLFPEHQGKYWVAVSLSEAETIRRILHVRKRKDPNHLIPNCSTEIALRYSPLSAPDAPIAGDGGIVFDASWGWQRMGTGSKATAFEAAIAHNSFRFFDCDMHFSQPSLNILIRVLKGSIRDREKFFASTVGCRRRMETKWQETPLVKVFTVLDEWVALKLRAQSVFVVEALKARNITLWEAFSAFDYDNNGILSPSEFYGALRWLNFPRLSAEDVADFIEAADKNRDGMIDYKEYIDMLSCAIDKNNDKSLNDEGDDGGDDDNKSPEHHRSILAKVEPYGAEEMREVIIHRKQNEIAHQRAERLRRQAYKDALDVKIFEEELEASKSRKGGANPLVASVSNLQITTSADGENASNEVRVTDYKFSTNQHPLRFSSTGKNNFIPYQIGTAADRPVLPMTCQNKHELTYSNYSWLGCRNCNGRGIHWYCFKGCCNFYVCARCFDGDKRSKQIEKADPARHSTFLRCSNGCSFTLQIPTGGGPSPTSGCFTITMQLRFERLPPEGSAQSLLRFSLPDKTSAMKVHRTSVYLGPNGRILPRYPSSISVVDTEASTDSDKNKDKVACIRPKVWETVSIVVEPSKKSMTTYINGCMSCHATELDTTELLLHHRLVVLGGGKQAHVRGGDIQRLVIHGAALSLEEVKAIFMRFANDNPGIGRQIVKFQSMFRGFKYRKSAGIVKGCKATDSSEAVEEEEDEDEE